MRRDLATALDGNDPLLIETLEYALLGGGKRVRPMLVGLGSRLCGVDNESLRLLGAAFEYLHVATLVHDDVIDEARERRGRESLVSAYGMTAAILTGDWLHARSMHLVAQTAGPQGLEVFCRATAGMVDGEYLQLRFMNNADITEKQYFSVITRKTAQLIESACEVAAIFAGATPEQTSALAAYGLKLGLAFQIVDDLLDYLGDAASTGKKIGQDFIEGKTTLPLIRALRDGDSSTGQQLRELIDNREQRAANFNRARQLIEANNGFATARARANELLDEAIAALDIFTAKNAQQSRNLLSGLALYILARDK